MRLNRVLEKKPPVAVYRHVDAALFGGYLPFIKNTSVDKKLMGFDSIVVSGHKFFGLDEPMGIFITTEDVRKNQNQPHIKYLNSNVPTITCSRSGLSSLKFWWKIKRNTYSSFKTQAETIISDALYLKQKLDKIGYPAWINPNSNTVFFKRPSNDIVKKWTLALSEDIKLGGELAHAVVMQHVTRGILDSFIEDLSKEWDSNKKEEL